MKQFAKTSQICKWAVFFTRVPLKFAILYETLEIWQTMPFRQVWGPMYFFILYDLIPSPQYITKMGREELRSKIVLKKPLFF